ncbi:DUF7007 domain-containing protein [Microbacterium enclense]|uniref:DUF7007 domain-containing protein n=1 Tax=Microbacterium enclense TaxID=993073 RepID=UPI003F7FC94A
MGIWDESKHDRDTAGKFTEMAGSEQSDALTFSADDAGCDSCGVNDRVPGTSLCVACTEDASCARCEAPVESDDGLCDSHAKRRGELTLREGSRTPWGAAQSVTNVAPGIALAGTAGHGGLKLSPERNALIPAALRNSSGWYEEDCEINIPLHYFPDEWCAQDWVKNEPAKLADETDRSIKDWFPEQWEKANGRELEPGESRKKDERNWFLNHRDVPIVTSASRAESDPDTVVVTARIGGHDGDPAAVTSEEYLVPRAEYDTRIDKTRQEPGQNGRFVVDPARHPKLPPKPARPRKTGEVVKVDPHTISASALSQAYIEGVVTATPRDRVAKDLGQRWRRADGRVESLRDILEEQGVSGKTAYQEGGSLKYALLQPTVDCTGHHSLRVSKATWDYLYSVPDDRTPSTRAYQEASAAQERLDRSDSFAPEYKRGKARVELLYANAQKLREQEDAERVAREGTSEAREVARKAAQAARERAATIS